MKAPFYRCRRCGHDFTVTAGTLFADTRKAPAIVVRAMWHVTNQKSGVSALGCSERSVWVVIARRGAGCISSDAPWCDQGAIG